MEPERAERQADEESPPFLGSWPRVYAAVLTYLAFLIATLYALTRFFD
jgi:hypothetical protein